MKKTTQAIIGVLLLLSILVVINGISGAIFGRFYWDLTEENLYSLSPGTKNILKNLEEPVRLKLYFSKTDAANSPGMKLYGKRVEDYLKQYQNVAGEKIKLEIYDPRPDSEEEDWASNYGLKAASLPSGEPLFLGLYGVNGRGQEEIIPFFDMNRQEFLEYDITGLIYSLGKEKKNIIGILSSVDPFGETPNPQQQPGADNSPWVAIEQLKQIAEVQKIDSSTETISEDVELLILIHPKNLGEKTLFAIDQYVMKGNNLLVFVDPYLELDNSGLDPNNPMSAYTQDKSSNLNKLLEKWGARFNSDNAVGDIDNATMVNAGNAGVQKFIIWLSLKGENVNKEDLTTSALENLFAPWAGAIEDTKAKNVTFTKLVNSGARANLISKREYMIGGGDPTQLLNSAVPGTTEYPLVVKLSGKFESNFPEGIAKDTADKNQSSASDTVIKESVSPSTIIVAGDVDMITNRFSVTEQNFFGTKLVRKINDNLNLFLNLAENLQGSNDLISLRSRGTFNRPFTRVQQMQTDAQQHWKIEENRLQAELNATNQRLSQLQGQSENQNSGEQIITPEMLEEIKKFREERKNVQKSLREVRKNLRQDIERLGNTLFFFNAFFIPLLIIFGTLLFKSISTKK